MPGIVHTAITPIANILCSGFPVHNRPCFAGFECIFCVLRVRQWFAR